MSGGWVPIPTVPTNGSRGGGGGVIAWDPREPARPKPTWDAGREVAGPGPGHELRGSLSHPHIPLPARARCRAALKLYWNRPPRKILTVSAARRLRGQSLLAHRGAKGTRCHQGAGQR